MTCIIGTISSRNSFNKFGLSRSGPAAFPGFRSMTSNRLKSSIMEIYFCISGDSASEGISSQSVASWSFLEIF